MARKLDIAIPRSQGIIQGPNCKNITGHSVKLQEEEEDVFFSHSLSKSYLVC